MIESKPESIRVVHPLFACESDGHIPASPLDMEFGEISVNLAISLNELWHSVLPKTVKSNLLRNKHKVFYAMFYRNIYYASAIWTSPVAGNRLKEKTCLELRRLTIANNAPKNTASRMLKLMRIDIQKQFSDITRLISYQSLEHHHGTIYKASNWISTSKSNSQQWHKGKKRNKRQIKSDKIRWELEL